MAREREARIDAVLTAVQRLADAPAAGFTESSSLSEPMVAWALNSTLRTVTEAAIRQSFAELDRLAADRRIMPAAECLVVLSGNLFTAPIRALLFPLLAGCNVTAKASSRDGGLPRALCRALAGTALEQRLRVVDATHQETTELASAADVVSVYGSDDTVSTIQAMLGPHQRLVPHGHGFGIAVVTRAAGRSLETTADEVALDIAAYDQRGCLSPQAVFVEEDRAFRFSKLLANALGALSARLPRGPLPIDAAASQMQWRGVASARGANAYTAASYCVTFEGVDDFRPSPGYRNMSVFEEAWPRGGIEAQLGPYLTHLKAIGVAGRAHEREEYVQRFRAQRPRVSQTGAMQTPGFNARMDGESPWAGLVQFE